MLQNLWQSHFKYISVKNAIKKLSAVEKLIQNDMFVEVVMDS